MFQSDACRRLVQHRGDIGRYATHEAHAMARDLMPKLQGRRARGLTDDHDRSPCGERQQRLLDRGIEPRSYEERGAEVRPYIEVAAKADKFVCKAGMPDGYALRLSRGP